MSQSEKCAICDKSVNAKVDIKCDKCLLLIHSTCSGLSRTEVQCLLSKDRHITYYCVKCTEKKDEIQDLKQLILSLKSEIESLKNNTSKNQESKHEYMEEIIFEINERNLRSSNVILLNVNESNASTSDERKSFDMKKSIEIINQVADVSTQNIKCRKTNGEQDITIKYIRGIPTIVPIMESKK
ncbi:hypothetical protein RN001_009362 [Aquatica leii]|uniref:Zinc finger PHD-type domain-containing protein n=1 Tax=Aquatica leii TaxID=1421715 RepID=A0AAN7S847_9COLE|nr:hypothetical protein RN001_009362 [Aquatica leii]